MTNSDRIAYFPPADHGILRIQPSAGNQRMTDWGLRHGEWFQIVFGGSGNNLNVYALDGKFLSRVARNGVCLFAYREVRPHNIEVTFWQFCQKVGP